MIDVRSPSVVVRFSLWPVIMIRSRLEQCKKQTKKKEAIFGFSQFRSADVMFLDRNWTLELDCLCRSQAKVNTGSRKHELVKPLIISSENRKKKGRWLWLRESEHCDTEKTVTFQRKTQLKKKKKVRYENTNYNTSSMAWFLSTCLLIIISSFYANRDQK